MKNTHRLSRAALFVLLFIQMSAVQADPGTGTLYGTDANGGNLITVNTGTGGGALVGNMAIGSTPSLVVDTATATMFAGGGSGGPIVYIVDQNNGNSFFLGNSGLGFAAIGGMDFSPGGTLYAAVNIAGDGGTGSDHLATINTANGAASVIGSFGACAGVPPLPVDGSGSCSIEGMEAIAFDAAGQLYGAKSARGAAGAPGLYQINPATGAAAFIAPILDGAGNPPSGGVVSLQFACDGTLYGGTARAIAAAGDGGRLIRIHPGTGAFTFIGGGAATGGSSLGALAFGDSCPGLGDIKPTPFVPTPTGNGRGIAFDGLNTLYYTLEGDLNIYMATPAGASLGPIPNPGRIFTCGVLEFHPPTGNLLCGTYDGTGTGGGATADFYSINPATGNAALLFNSLAFGGLDGNTCIASFFGFMDGLSWDASDNTLWLSDDISRTIYHVGFNGAFIASFNTPVRPGATQPGCNSGIEVVPGGFLELMLLPVDDGDPFVGHIVKVSKDDPSGDLIAAFPVVSLVEDIDFDAKTFAPRAVLWSNAAGTNLIEAYDVQVTRTIGYWKNHPAADFDGTSFLPIDLGVSDVDSLACMTAEDQDDVEAILKAHKGQDAALKLKAQLLATKLNLVMGDIPPDDIIAIAPIVFDADELLGRNGCDPDTGKKGADRAEATLLHAILTVFNELYSP